MDLNTSQRIKKTKNSKSSKSKIEPDDYIVVFNLRRSLAVDPDEDDLVLEILGDILHANEDMEMGKRIVGSCKAYLFQLEKAQAMGFSLLQLFDLIDDDIAECFTVIFDEEEEIYSKSVTMLDGDDPMVMEDLLIINEVHIKPQFRGGDLGLLAADSILETFGSSCRYAFLRPFPLQFGPWKSYAEKEKKILMGEKLSKVSRDEAFKKIRKHWQELGFKPIQNSEIFGMSLLMKRPRMDLRAKKYS